LLPIKYHLPSSNPIQVPDANSFSAFIKTLDYEEQPYIGGNAVRRVVAERVFTSNESPPR